MKLIILLASLFFRNPADHDFKIGRFEIRPNGKETTLFVRLDRYDLLEAIKGECNDYNKLGECFTDYIDQHVQLTFDGTKAALTHQNHAFEGEFIEITFNIPVESDGVENIEVYNDVFLEKWDMQENIVYSLLNDARRSFRLNKDRLSTVISYD